MEGKNIVHGWCFAGAMLLGFCLCGCGSLGGKGKSKSDASTAKSEALSSASYDPLSLPAPTSPEELIPGVAPKGMAGVPVEGAVMDFASLTQNQGWRPTLSGWERSASQAIRKAHLQNRLLLVVATNVDQNSEEDLSRKMETSLLATPDFKKAVEEGYVLLHLDYGEKETASSEYYRDFRQRLKIRGFPSFLIMLPNGREVFRTNGYTPDWNARYVQSIQDAKGQGAKMAAARRKQMEAYGYRAWKDQKGTEVFAKLSGIEANQLTFLGEWGDEFRTFLNRLSDTDQAMIAKHGTAL